MARKLPEFILTKDPGSFARRTITERKPHIIRDVIRFNTLRESALQKLHALEEEIKSGKVNDPFNGVDFPSGAFAEEEREAWGQEIALYEGRSWLDIPWYFAESFFYLKLLIAVGYCDGQAPDPFQVLKDEELFGAEGGLFLARAAMDRLASPRLPLDSVVFLLLSSLWGNRVDLSNEEIPREGRDAFLKGGGENLILDDSLTVAEKLLHCRRLDVVTDNAGPELVFDLLLADRLLGLGEPPLITLHLKKAPFFVSDAMSKDVLQTIHAFTREGDHRVRAAGGRLKRSMEEGSLALADHFFWNGPRCFTRLPREIRESFAASDLVVFKGDANYRRLLEDRKWKPWVSLEEETRYFPVPFAAVRTMKSEIVADIPREKAEALAAEDRDWLTNGKRGIIRYCEPLHRRINRS